MSKNHRGSGIRSLPNHGRGTCAICGKTKNKKELKKSEKQISKFSLKKK